MRFPQFFILLWSLISFNSNLIWHVPTEIPILLLDKRKESFVCKITNPVFVYTGSKKKTKTDDDNVRN
jgi:hypothetical protein